MTRVTWSKAARDDLDSVWLAIAVHDLAAADRLVEAVEARIALLQQFPHIGSPTDSGVRKLTIGRFPYALSYAATAEAILILAIRHMAQRTA